MQRKTANLYNFRSRESDYGSIVEQYSIVEFSTSNSEPTYQFQLRDLPMPGMNILVKENSAILKNIKVGDILNMKYYRKKMAEMPDCLSTEIIQITKNDQGRFRGHYLVHLSVLEKQNISLI